MVKNIHPIIYNCLSKKTILDLIKRFYRVLFSLFENKRHRIFLNNFLFWLSINIIVIYILFPKIASEGVLWFSDNRSIISWINLWKYNGIYLWKDQISLGINSFDNIQFTPLYALFAFLNKYVGFQLLSKFQVLLPIIILNTCVIILIDNIFGSVKYKKLYIFLFIIIFQFNSSWLNMIYSGFAFQSISLAFIPLFFYFIHTKKINLAILTSLTIPFSTLPGAFIFILYYILTLLLFVEQKSFANILKQSGLVFLLNMWWLLPITMSFFITTVDNSTKVYSQNILSTFSSSAFSEMFLFNTPWQKMLEFGANPKLVFYLDYKFTLISLLIFSTVLFLYIFLPKDSSLKIEKTFLLMFIFMSLSIFIRDIPLLNIIFKSTNRFLWIPLFLTFIVFALLCRRVVDFNVPKYKRSILLILLIISGILLTNFISTPYKLEPYTIPEEYVNLSEESSYNYERTFLLPSKNNWYLETTYQPKFGTNPIGVSDPLQYSLSETLSFFVRFEPYTGEYLTNHFQKKVKSDYLSDINTLRINRVIMHNYAIDKTTYGANIIVENLLENKDWSYEPGEALDIYHRNRALLEFDSDFNMTYEKIYPGKFRLYLKNVNTTGEIIFYQSYHSELQLFVPTEHLNIRNFKCNQTNEINSIERCNNFNQILYEGEELSYLWKEPIFERSHHVAYDYANSWVIDPIYIKANYPNHYKENPDGSIDMELILYFRPQSYFYLGIVISGTTLLTFISYIFWNMRKRKSTKETSLHEL